MSRMNKCSRCQSFHDEDTCPKCGHARLPTRNEVVFVTIAIIILQILAFYIIVIEGYDLTIFR